MLLAIGHTKPSQIDLLGQLLKAVDFLGHLAIVYLLNLHLPGVSLNMTLSG